MQRNIWPTLLIILGIFFTYLMLASPTVTPLPFLALALAIGLLGSGIVLFIANKKYSIPAKKTLSQLEAEHALLQERLTQAELRLTLLENEMRQD